MIVRLSWPPPAVPSSAPPWMSCYADLMTELVCFFVILYALSAALNKNVQNAQEQPGQ